ncbi:MAG: excinuclease ABC subunit UvrC [Myxococcales bacterium]|nr:excinuclease ABC subunit UvrC [Myxococcales bacterium]
MTRPPLSDEQREALLSSLPQRAGVYQFVDTDEAVVYVGKARNLRHRVRSYFGAPSDPRPFVGWLPALLSDIRVIVCRNEREALLLERELIARLRPRYNVDLQDDKNFFVLCLSRHPFPRLSLERLHPRGGSPARMRDLQCFGPYPSAEAARELLRFLQRAFGLRVCSDRQFTSRTRPCLRAGIGRCLAPCTGTLALPTYAERVREAQEFLRGRGDGLLRALQERMWRESERENFEEAARLRDRLRLVERSLARQQVVDPAGGDADVLGIHREGGGGALLWLRVRAGRAADVTRHFFEDAPLPTWELVRRHLLDRAAAGLDAARRWLIPGEALEGAEAGEEVDALSTLLSEQAGQPIEVHTPRRGPGASMLELARENAAQAFRQRLATTSARRDRLRRLQARLFLRSPPRRIECFDLAVFQGAAAVGAMAVLRDGQPAPAEYRRFRIRAARCDSDVDMLQEVLRRRLRRARSGELPLPDLLLVDGGVQQLNAARQVVAELGLDGLSLAALAKGGAGAGRHRVTRERVFLPGRKNPIRLRPESDELFLLSRIRDEAHRFAGAYHRALRRAATLKSGLEEIPGVGPTLRRRLLLRFGSLRRVRQAPAEELARVPGVTVQLAKRIARFLGGAAFDLP